jgi:tetratricopeptide (TPR) repeat protein
VLADRREREGAAVVSALTEFDPAGYCGGHWAVLVAGACEELGLTQESTDAYVLALRKLPASDLRNKTILRLAARYQAENQLEEARLLLATLTSAEATQMSLQARLDSAEVALKQNRPDEAISVCRLLIDSTDEPQSERAALRIMGQAFERQQNHQAAIYCFAGMLPEQDSAEDLNHSSQPETSGGHK